MSGRKRVLFLLLIMAAVSFILVGISVSILYNTALEEGRGRLVETAQSQARLIEAVARFDALFSKEYPEGPEAATLTKVKDAHSHHKGFGKTGEFTLARLEKDNIVFLLSHRHFDLDRPKPVAFKSTIAEPMRRALSGRSGTVVGLDYRGETVLAAYEPVGELNFGIVAKIDLTEVQAPFKRAILMALGVSVLVILGGASLIFGISNPIIKRLEKHSSELRTTNDKMKREIDERIRAEDDLKWELFVNSALSEMYEPLTSPSSSIEEIAKIILHRAKKLTNSDHGYVSSIDPSTGDNVAHTLTEMLTKECTVTEKDSRIVFPKGEDGRYHGLWGYALNMGEAFFANSPDTHEASMGIPEGHVPLERFLSVPVLLDKNLVGQIALANKDMGYTERDLEAVRRFGEYYALAIQRKRAEEALQKAHDGLELRIEARTADLAEANRQLKREIEMRTRSEEVLKAKDKSLSEAQRIANVGNWDWNIITNELSWSDEIYRIFGLRPQEFGATYDDFLSSVHPDDRETVGNAVTKALADPNVQYSIEHRVVRPAGSERTVHERGEVTFDADGKPIRMIGTVQDITEHKLAEKTQMEAKLKYRTVADFTYDWEYWVNDDGTLQYISPSCRRISGYEVRQFMENPSLFRDIILEEDKEIWDRHHRDSRLSLRPREIQFRIHKKDGEIRWIEHVCQPVTDERGISLGFRASNRDVTERKQAELDLQEALSEIKDLKDQLELESAYLREEIKLEHDFENIVGKSDALKYVLYKVEQVASTDTTAIVLGETGTGKELVARAIHDSSLRKDHPMIKLNCAALPSHLIESELFGHERGAFTGAHAKQVGRFELADNTTLFLDEIGELPMELQAKLLRVLQDGEFERLGSSRTIKVNVRIIAASNRNLEEEIRNGRFREDLWFRLSVFPITVPPLRDRIEDIPLLVEHFIGTFSKKLGKSIENVPMNVMKTLQDYPWPGNVRELANVIERAVINTSGSKLFLADKLNEPHKDLTKSGKSLEEVEHDYILQVLEEKKWRIDGSKGAAVILGLNPSTLRSRMRKLGIQKT